MSDAMTSDQKIALITGATSGIGEVAAIELAKQGFRVGVVGRNAAKCAATAAKIKREAATPLVDTFLADLSTQADVHRLADEVKAQYPRLDVLLNNAGAMISPRQESADGIEQTWALNHLAYFLLTDLLLDLLNSTPGARVVSVASDAHRMARNGINFADVERKNSYSAWSAYSQSKLANILFTRELARRLKSSGSTVTANCLHPGFVKTNFAEGKGLGFWAFRQLSNVIAISPAKGAETSIYLATSPEVAGKSGGYYAKSRPNKPTAAAQDDAAAKRLWTLSETMTKHTAHA